ncbi:MAG: manganese efflux pump [Treponema sp.]|nr:manganese efflux pump [Spirochaetales bacterium]MDY6190924.1 manganese efflux pump [Treponema sp.]
MEFFLFLVNSVLMGIGLAMDAFSVSLTNGLNENQMKIKRMCLIAGCFTFFQFIMPVLGWILVHTVSNYFEKFSELIPWIALFLLLYIGGKMLIEAVHKSEEDENVNKLTFSVLILQGIATSIDALSVGFAIADYNFLMALASSVIIAVVTFVICIGGLIIGKKAGTVLKRKAGLLGGFILIGIGIEIFIRGMLA